MTKLVSMAIGREIHSMLISGNDPINVTQVTRMLEVQKKMPRLFKQAGLSAWPSWVKFTVVHEKKRPYQCLPGYQNAQNRTKTNCWGCLDNQACQWGHQEWDSQLVCEQKWLCYCQPVHQNTQSSGQMNCRDCFRQVDLWAWPSEVRFTACWWVETAVTVSQVTRICERIKQMNWQDCLDDQACQCWEWDS